ncbi:hypothetical protein [Flavobacterium sp. N502540]|uniref:hypothetical protein n=1 Tax=Flavobacterium sp. N502540 TaxID=2986838 RepID=UPI0022254735|nr:hypothetical protein [Flavobacterium sp. N502540]
MIEKKLKEILSLNGISILIGIVGGILGIISIFIDWNTQLSIKWVAGLCIIFSFFLIISLKLTFDIYMLHKLRTTRNNKVIQFSSTDSLLLVENNNNLEYSQSVSIFFIKNNFQLLLASGYVQNIQDKFVQVKIINFDDGFINSYRDDYERILNNDNNALISILIKNYISYNG